MKIGARIYRHPDGRFEARYRRGRREDGSILYGSVYGASCEEAEEKRAQLLQDMARRAEEDGNTEAAAIFESNRGIREYYTEEPKGRTLYPAPLTEEQVSEFIPHLRSMAAHVRLSLSFSLYMGVSGEELAALKYSDIDIQNARLHVRRSMADVRHMPGTISPCETRTVVIPRAAWKYALFAECVAGGGDRYLLSDSETPVKSLRSARLLWKRQLAEISEQLGVSVTPEVLRATFIRRSFERGLNTETVARITGVSATALRSRYGHFASANAEILREIEYPDDPLEEKMQTRQMNLLILGAGSHGHAVYELAEKLGVFQKIAFLDDKITGDHVIGRVEDCERYVKEYPLCFIAIGQNQRRRELAERATAAGFIIPRLISADTSVARGVKIGRGTIIMPQATVHTGAVIGDFCIIASNALISFNATVGDYAHCDCASVVMKDCAVPEMAMIQSGDIVRG